MKTIYRCDVCGREFNTPLICGNHEASHFSGDERIKYDILHNNKEYICNYCDHSYYVYGCEQDCEFSNCCLENNYKDFKPVKPFHNKRAHGGV